MLFNIIFGNVIAMTNTRIVNSKYDHIGIYVWELPNGKFLADEQKRVLSISSIYGDVKKMSKITSAAAAYGFPNGKPRFMPGHRKVTDEEYDNQTDRMLNGLIPDEYDVAAYEEEAVARKHAQ